MVQLVRKSNSLTIVTLLYIHIFASPFHSQFKRCTECQSIYGDLSNKPTRSHSAQRRGQPTEAQTQAAKSERDQGTIIIQDQPEVSTEVDQPARSISYCDEISQNLYGNKSLYCVDHNYCPSIEQESEEQVRQLTCGIKHDGSIRVCCNVLNQRSISGRSSSNSEGTLVITDPSIGVLQREHVHSRRKPTMSDSSDLSPDIRATSERSRGSNDRSFPKDCGLSIYSENQYEARIIGGETAHKNAWPWFALIMFQRKPGGRKSHECGGTLVSEKFVLTAAHCLLEQSRLSRPVRNSMITVRLGEHDLKSADGEVDVGVSRILVHPAFNSKTFKNDIALIELDRKMAFSESIMPACVPHDIPSLSNTSASALTGHQAWVIGYGQTSYNGRTSDLLKQVDLRIYDHNKCKYAFAHLLRISAEYVCASSFVPPHIDDDLSAPVELDGTDTKSSKTAAKDSCKGDSGGPLLVQSSNAQSSSPSPWYIYGIVSFGYKCASAEYPGVYTRVNHYLDWLGMYL